MGLVKDNNVLNNVEIKLQLLFQYYLQHCNILNCGLVYASDTALHCVKFKATSTQSDDVQYSVCTKRKVCANVIH